jgi:hypothetical protein
MRDQVRDYERSKAPNFGLNDSRVSKIRKEQVWDTGLPTN